MKQVIATLLILALIAAGYFAWKMYGRAPSEVPVAITAFACEQGKTIGAVFYKTKVDLTLSDGRKITLAQVTSASGARYANANESFVFWNKGNTAYIAEGESEPQAQSYTNCVSSSGAGEQVDQTTTYAYPPLGFSIRYPKSYTLSESYMYQGLGEEGIPGIKVSVSSALAAETNLGSDSGVSIEYVPNAENCTASIFLYGNPPATTENDGGTTSLLIILQAPKKSSTKPSSLPSSTLSAARSRLKIR
jgi:membrane-bound inhibitor of C-type lysozyme